MESTQANLKPRKPPRRMGLVEKLRVQSRELSKKLSLTDIQEVKQRFRADTIIHKTIDATSIR